MPAQRSTEGQTPTSMTFTHQVVKSGNHHADPGPVGTTPGGCNDLRTPASWDRPDSEGDVPVLVSVSESDSDSEWESDTCSESSDEFGPFRPRERLEHARCEPHTPRPNNTAAPDSKQSSDKRAETPMTMPKSATTTPYVSPLIDLTPRYALSSTTTARPGPATRSSTARRRQKGTPPRTRSSTGKSFPVLTRSDLVVV